LSPEDLKSLQEIAGVMKGHPLAIKLTASLLVRQSIASIRDELRRNPPQEVSQRFDVSFNSLSEGQKDLFCRLAVFSGSVTEEAIGSICIEDEASDWQSDLGELERRSFLDRIEIAAQDQDGNEVTLSRYKLHPLMRQYATAKAGEELLTGLRPRATAYFLEYAENHADHFFMLSLEHENLLAAMDWLAGQQGSTSSEGRKAASNSVLQFMSALDGYLDTLGYWSEYDRRLKQAVSAAEALEDKKQMAGWIHNLGILLQKTGNYEAARKLHQQSLEIKKELGDKSGVSSSLHQLGWLAQDTGDYDQARKLYQQSLEIKQELGDKNGVAFSLAQLALMEEKLGRIETAVELTAKAESIFNEINNPFLAERARNQRKRLESLL